MNVQTVREYLLGLQSRIIAAIEVEDGHPFLTDHWVREPGGKLQGEGLSRLVEEGGLLERGGCSFSHVKGQTLPPSATQHRPDLAGAPFEAMGVSLVFHPRNPHVPTVHMNVRMLAALPEGREPVTWFGGGMDQVTASPPAGNAASMRTFMCTVGTYGLRGWITSDTPIASNGAPASS